MLRPLSAMVLLMCAVSPGPSAAGDKGLPPPVVPAGFGVNIHFTDPGPGEMDRFVEAGYRFVRMDFAWGAVERQAGRYEFGAYDRLLGHLEPAGARPIFILDYGNRLYDQGSSPRSDSARAAFARFAAAAARHFHSQGVIWEIWNEPNIQQFWKPRPDADAYARLALETARAVRTADPEAVILAPGSSEFPWAFLETVFAAGLLDHIDAVSVHPYRESAPETAARDYGRLRALIGRYAPPARMNLPIISSEWGYSTAEGAVSEAQQARYLVRQWLVNLASGVNLSIFYDWKDDGDDAKDREARFGTVRRNLQPKPSFLAAQALTRTLGGYAFRHRLQGTSSSEWKLLFEQAEKPGGLMLVEWSADPKGDDVRQTPAFHPVAPDQSDVHRLRRLANVQFAAGPLVENQGHPAVLPLTIVNSETHPARIRLVATAEGHAPSTLLDVTLQPGEKASRSLTLPGGRFARRTSTSHPRAHLERPSPSRPGTPGRLAHRSTANRRGPPGSGAGSHRGKPRTARVQGPSQGGGRRDGGRWPGSAHQQGARPCSGPAPAARRIPSSHADGRAGASGRGDDPNAIRRHDRLPRWTGFGPGDGLDPVRRQCSAAAPCLDSGGDRGQCARAFVLEVPYHFDPGWHISRWRLASR